MKNTKSDPAFYSFGFWISVLHYFLKNGDYSGPRELGPEFYAWMKDNWHCTITEDEVTHGITHISVDADHLTMLMLAVDYED